MKRVILVYFSPTHTTQKVLRAISEGVCVKDVMEIDLTKTKECHFTPMDEDIILVGAPVYGGRVPYESYKRLNQLKGNGQAAVCVSVYGNHSAGAALKELNNMLSTNGFHVIAGATFIGEHSFSNKKHKIAPGRPNEKDLAIAKEFGNKIQNKLKNTTSLKNLKITSIKGKLSEKPAGNFIKAKSEATDKCIKCGRCITVCPVGAIDKDLQCNADLCIKCYACVKECPEDARIIKSIPISIAAFALSKSSYKTPKLYI